MSANTCWTFEDKRDTDTSQVGLIKRFCSSKRLGNQELTVKSALGKENAIKLSLLEATFRAVRSSTVILLNYTFVAKEIPTTPTLWTAVDPLLYDWLNSNDWSILLICSPILPRTETLVSSSDENLEYFVGNFSVSLCMIHRRLWGIRQKFGGGSSGVGGIEFRVFCRGSYGTMDVYSSSCGMTWVDGVHVFVWKVWGSV